MTSTVLFVTHGLGIGGAELQLLEYVRRAPSCLSPRLVYLRDQSEGRDLRDDYRRIGIEPQRVGWPWLPVPAALPWLRREIAALRPAIVHTWLDGSAGTWGRVAAVLAGAPRIIHSSRALSPRLSGTQRFLEPWLDRLTTRMLPNAQAIRDRLLASGVPGERIKVLPNGVDLSRFTCSGPASYRREWEIPETALVLGFLGRFRPVKRIDLLLDAVLSLPESMRPDYMVIGGDGPLWDEVKGRVGADPWLREHCRLPGIVSDVPRFMASIDYLVLSSDHEGLPNVVLEAMASGRPVVATAVSDLPRLLEGAGFLVPPGDSNLLAEGLQAIRLVGIEERRRMGETARRRVQEAYDFDHSAEVFWEAHREVLQ